MAPPVDRAALRPILEAALAEARNAGDVEWRENLESVAAQADAKELQTMDHPTAIEGRCDCGGVRWSFEGDPGTLTLCNCGFCRRSGALWAYGSVLNIRIEGETVPYLRGDRTLTVNHCPTCGAVTHWESVMPPGHEGHGRRAVNMRLADPTLVLGRPVERLDGAGTWRALEPGEQAEVPFLTA